MSACATTSRGDVRNATLRLGTGYLIRDRDGQDRSTTRAVLSGDRGAFAQLIAGIVVHKDTLIVGFKSDRADPPGIDFDGAP